MNDGQLIQRLRDLDRPAIPDPAFADALFASLRAVPNRRPMLAGPTSRALAVAGAAAAVLIAAVMALSLLTGGPRVPAGTPFVLPATPSVAPRATEPAPSPPASPTPAVVPGWRQAAAPPTTTPTLIGWRDGDVWAFVTEPDPEAHARLVTYDVTADEWTERGEVPFGRSLSDLAPTASVFGANGDILLFGHADRERAVWRIDSETLEATGLAPELLDGWPSGFTVARTGPDGRVYLLESPGAAVNSPVSLVIYDPLLDEFIAAPEMPTSRIRPQLVVDASGTAHVIGGGAETGPILAVERFDPATGEWSTGPTLPADAMVGGSRFGHAATSGPDGALHIYSHTGERESPLTIYRLAPAGDAWEELPGPPLEPHNAVIDAEGTVLLVGHEHDTRLSGDQPLDAPVTWIWDVEEQP